MLRTLVVRSNQHSANKGLLLFGVLGLLVSCQSRPQEPVLSRTAPDGSKRIEVWRVSNRSPDYSVGATFYGTSDSAVIYNDSSQRVGMPAEIYWSADSRLTGILICGGFGTEDIVIGFDTQPKKLVSKSLIIEPLRQLILNKHSPSKELLNKYGDDVLEWFCQDRNVANRFAETVIDQR